MYVVMNELFIPAEHKEQMIKRFANSAENMKRVPGCIEFMFLNHEKEDGKQIVLTKWESKEHFLAWVESDAFKNAHQQNRSSNGKPQGNTNEINAYEVVYRT